MIDQIDARVDAFKTHRKSLHQRVDQQ
jgi:hypothetical protein